MARQNLNYQKDRQVLNLIVVRLVQSKVAACRKQIYSHLKILLINLFECLNQICLALLTLFVYPKKVDKNQYLAELTVLLVVLALLNQLFLVKEQVDLNKIFALLELLALLNLEYPLSQNIILLPQDQK